MTRPSVSGDGALDSDCHLDAECFGYGLQVVDVKSHIAGESSRNPRLLAAQFSGQLRAGHLSAHQGNPDLLRDLLAQTVSHALIMPPAEAAA